MARLPDGYVFTFTLTGKGTAGSVKKRELVLCQNCKYAVTAWENGQGGYCCTNPRGAVVELIVLPPDWFCADGERRTE